MADPMSDGPVTADGADDQPRTIRDRYEVVRILGQGSAAKTLLCQDRQEARHVAVKELHFEHLDDWKHLELFEREAKVLSMLDHPGIPKIHDFFQQGEGQTSLYIVQEYVEGVSLADRMESGPMLGQQEVHDLTVELLDVLDYLHGRAPPVLHRDIKPSNVLLRASGEAVLIDFGGVSFGWRPPNPTGATVVGTFGYMPPEQLVGQSAPTSDLYALGATVLHLVTGTPPGEFPFDSGRIEVPADLPAPRSLARLIEALLRPAPRDRPQTAEAAQKILRGSAATTAAVATRAPAPTRAVVPPRSLAVSDDHGPRFVEMGRPTRDPKGEFKDVYRNLMNPLFPSRRLWPKAIHVGWVTVSSVLSVLSLGTVPLIYKSTREARKRTYGALFQRGEFTTGVIRAVSTGALYSRIKYEFEVDGTAYGGFMEYAAEMPEFWGEGDPVPVLYDANDPRLSCFVYR